MYPNGHETYVLLFSPAGTLTTLKRGSFPLFTPPFADNLPFYEDT